MTTLTSIVRDSTENSASTAPVAQKQICILLVEDNEDQMLLVKYTLEECGDGRYQLEWVNRLSEGVKRLSKGGVDVVLLDLGLAESSGPATYTTIRSAAPNVPVVILTSDDREQTEFMVMTYGAEDYLIKEEVSGTHLLRAIRGAMYRNKNRSRFEEPAQNPQQTGYTIGFLGAKGGVGVTSAVLNIAAILGPHRRTIVIETARYRGGFSLQLGNMKHATVASLSGSQYGGWLSAEAFSEIVVPTSLGAGILFEPLAHCEDRESTLEHAHQILGHAKHQADFVLVDAGSQWDELTRSVISKCQSVVLVVDREPTSLAAAREWMQWLRQIEEIDCEISVLLINRSGLSNNTSIEQMRTTFACPVIGPIPCASDRMAWALERYRPLAYLDPEDPVTDSVSEIGSYFTEQASRWSKLPPSPVEQENAAEEL